MSINPPQGSASGARSPVTSEKTKNLPLPLKHKGEKAGKTVQHKDSDEGGYFSSDDESLMVSKGRLKSRSISEVGKTEEVEVLEKPKKSLKDCLVMSKVIQNNLRLVENKFCQTSPLTEFSHPSWFSEKDPIRHIRFYLQHASGRDDGLTARVMYQARQVEQDLHYWLKNFPDSDEARQDLEKAFEVLAAMQVLGGKEEAARETLTKGIRKISEKGAPNLITAKKALKLPEECLVSDDAVKVEKRAIDSCLVDHALLIDQLQESVDHCMKLGNRRKRRLVRAAPMQCARFYVREAEKYDGEMLRPLRLWGRQLGQDLMQWVSIVESRDPAYRDESRSLVGALALCQALQGRNDLARKTYEWGQSLLDGVYYTTFIDELDLDDKDL
ncbi:hypothetical protein M3P05_13990 [Sansalvadorimonas sp. 2012CJ34-2]|uniref:Uncharacterized protein n=1 Tax=Parendozoicomonas callyspongiae TaxID=2942213 RepID=A0ABT0PI40_9GAMM|nr:hypothetical protein [Sansalvadorimonas sp. 2012CJ34-2]MCL6271038.1 hypothetical protein [Sansalvadorimonas sp. 2012CJ34-2]